MSLLRKRLVGLLLLASLVLNLFLAGLFIGDQFRRHPHRPPPLPGLTVADWNPGGFAEALRRLPDALREPARAVLDRHREEMRGAARRLVEAREGVLSALQDTTANGALETALAELRESGMAAQEAFHAVLIDLDHEVGPQLFEAVRDMRPDWHRPPNRDGPPQGD